MSPALREFALAMSVSVMVALMLFSAALVITRALETRRRKARHRAALLERLRQLEKRRFR